MKNILLFVHDDEGQEARLQVALDVTRAMGGHLTCFDIAIPAMIGDDFYSGAGQAIVMAEERVRESDNRERLEARLAHESVAWDWQDWVGFPGSILRDTADLADLIVVSSGIGQHGGHRALSVAGEVVVKSHRPVLAVPNKAHGLAMEGPVVVAWDGSCEATEAMRAAVPLLALAGEVRLLHFTDRNEAIEPRMAAQYLSRHDIHAEVVELEKSGPVADALLAQTRARNAGYLVMGAYGHARMSESLFGGVTRTMLMESPVPLFLAH